MGERIERVFYIPEERLFNKQLPEDRKKKQIGAICKAISHSERSVRVHYEIESNGTVKFTIEGGLEATAISIALLERNLTMERRQDRRYLPQDVGISALTVENLKAHNQQMRKLRQFGCRPCQNVWWRKIFTYKPVSRCSRCKICYEAIPVTSEFGWGKFACSCGNVFWGRAQSGVPAMCHLCRQMVLPEIGSINIRQGGGARATRNRHSCAMCDNGRIHPCPSFQPVLVASLPHICTGSTATTFITQQSMDYQDPLN